jgi:hypothetical protein
MGTLTLRFLALVLAAFAIPGMATAADRGTADTITYRVLKGDNLYTLAGRYLTRTEDYIVVQRLNRVADPYRIPIGTRLVIPRNLLRQDPARAVVHAFRGSVRVGKRGRQAPAAVGMTVAEGDLIETGEKSFVSLRMPDGTAVALPSQTRVRVERLRRKVLAGDLERSFAIEKGRARATVEPHPDSRNEFRFSTPVAVSAVRGTVLRMGYDPASGRATSEVLEGKVQFSKAGGEMQLVPAGFGAGSNLTGTLPLLAAPQLAFAGRVQSEDQLHFAIQPLAGASRYHVQIAQDAGFLEVLDETETTSSEVQFPSIPNGGYFVRVTGVDGNALEGLPATYGFQRRLNRITTTAEQKRAGRYHEYLFRWYAPDTSNAQYRFQLSTDPDGASPLVDEPGLTQPSFMITDLPSGVYFWRVKVTEFVDGEAFEKWTPIEELRVETAR